MLKVNFNDKDIAVSYDGGEWLITKINNSWLWLIGALENGEKIKVRDERKELQDHQHNMTFSRGLSESNYLMLIKLLDVYKPKRRGIMSEEEYVLISETLHLKERNVIDLRNLRDFVVALLSRDDDMKTLDKMSAITHVIDIQLVGRGAEI